MNDMAAMGNATRDLLSCPFCGGSKLLICETTFEPESRPAYTVACTTHDCAGVIFTLGFGLFASRKDAVDAWNHRAAQSALDAEAMMEAARRLCSPQGKYCSYCRTNTHNDAECWCTRPADWKPQEKT